MVKASWEDLLLFRVAAYSWPAWVGTAAVVALHYRMPPNPVLQYPPPLWFISIIWGVWFFSIVSMTTGHWGRQ